VLDELQVVAGPRTNVSLKLRQTVVKVGRLEIFGDDQQVDIRVAAGVAASHGPEEPCTVQVGPRREPLAQPPDQFPSQPRKSEHRPSREVVSGSAGPSMLGPATVSLTSPVWMSSSMTALALPGRDASPQQRAAASLQAARSRASV